MDNGGYMFKKFIFSLFCISALISNSAKAVYFCGEVLKKDDITVVLLGDLHIDKKDKIITTKQQSDLTNIAKKVNAFWFIEDAFSTLYRNIPLEKTNEEEQKQEYQNSAFDEFICCSPLLNFCKILKNNSISCINSKCRLSRRYKSILQFIHNKLQFFYSLDKNSPYKSHIAELITYIDLLIQNVFLENEEYFKLYSKYNSATLFDLNIFCDFYGELIENHHKLFIFCCGSGHIKPISRLIQSICKFNTVGNYNIDSIERDDDDWKSAERKSFKKALDLPKFFDQYVFNQPKSKL